MVAGLSSATGSTSSDKARMFRSHILRYQIIKIELTGAHRRVGRRELARSRTIKAVRHWKTRLAAKTWIDLMRGLKLNPSASSIVAPGWIKKRLRAIARLQSPHNCEHFGQFFQKYLLEDPDFRSVSANQ